MNVRAFLLAIALPLAGLGLPSPALASHGQVSIFQDRLATSAALAPEFRALGASTVRIIVDWSDLAPSSAAPDPPAGVDLTDPNSYAPGAWAPYDAAIQAAQQNGLSVELTLSGPGPRWGEDLRHLPRGFSPLRAWKPIPAYYGDFVQAIGTRYSGNFTPATETVPLPAVHVWSLWNEPNFGYDLAPQAQSGSKLPVAPVIYRGLVEAGWTGLQRAGHGGDTILIGEVAPRGLDGPVTRAHPQGLPGFYSQTKPLQFIRTLYCLDASYRRLTGAAARAVSCPTSAVAFRRQNPGLFSAGGFADHPYQTVGASAPVGKGHGDPDFATFPQLAGFEKGLDRVLRADGSRRRYAIWSDEFGYITRPPDAGAYPSASLAADYLNWTEYLSWRNPRVASYAQYLFTDPRPGPGAFASGLESGSGRPKATFYAYRLPLYLPVTTIKRHRSAEVWGDVRPAHYLALDSGQTQLAQIEYQRGGSGAYRTVRTVTVSSPEGYFDLHVSFPAAGTVRLAYTYPMTDSFLPSGLVGQTIYSRTVRVTIGK